MFILHVTCGGVVNFNKCLAAADGLSIIFVNSLWCQKRLGKPVTHAAYAHQECSSGKCFEQKNSDIPLSHLGSHMREVLLCSRKQLWWKRSQQSTHIGKSQQLRSLGSYLSFYFPWGINDRPKLQGQWNWKLEQIQEKGNWLNMNPVHTWSVQWQDVPGWISHPSCCFVHVS